MSLRQAPPGPAYNDWSDANQAFLSAALAVTARRLDGADASEELSRCVELRQQLSTPPAIESIAAGFGLSDFEREMLLLCAGVEFDAGVARACAEANGDPARPYATFSLAMVRLPDPHWSAISPAAPLRRWHLVELAHPEIPTASPVRIDERVMHALAGIGYLDPRIDCVVETLSAPARLPPGLCAAAEQLAACWALPNHRTVRVPSRPRADVRAVTAAAAAQMGARAVSLGASDLPGTAAEREQLARICERESVLSSICWLVEVDDPLAESGRAGIGLARRLHAPVALACDIPVDDQGGGSIVVDVPPISPVESRALWRDALGTAAPGDLGWADRLAGQFCLGPSDIQAVMSAVAVSPGGTPAGALTWQACRARARPALDGLAQRVDARSGWAELVLPAAQSRLLREMASHVRHRLTVFEDWGFGARTSRGSGVAALFAGPSGTGKTLAAEVVAGELALDLYRVDLSQVVSKYIGETEKNLRRIFDAAEVGGVVLLFDEADALFGKRSEVKDSHDRYANIEVSYLLQRMETYRGLAILTTNLKDAIDTAFLRRLRFIVHFPFPDAAGRADIWRRIFPAETPTEGLMVDKLARLEVAGGAIRNIALSAAFLAAEEGSRLRMGHCLLAARTEYGKLGKPLTDAEVAGWIP